jgi:GTPase SAR1 family protein
MTTKDNGERTQRKELGTVQKVCKFGLVGDGTVGKTTILLTYTTQTFVKDYVPTGLLLFV